MGDVQTPFAQQKLEQSRLSVQAPPTAVRQEPPKQNTDPFWVGCGQQSSSTVQAPRSGTQQVPLLQVWPEGHVPVWQLPPQPSSSPHALPVQLGVQHDPLKQVWPEAQPQEEPHTSLVGQHDPLRQVSRAQGGPPHEKVPIPITGTAAL
jgi:hypothetical protein